MSTTKLQEEQSTKSDEKLQPMPQSDQAPSYLADSQVKTLHFKYSNLKWTKADVIDDETDNIVYNTVVKGLLQSKMQYFEPGGTTPIAEAVFHTSRIDLTIRGQTMKLKVPHMLSTNYSYHSPALGNQEITWVSKCRLKTIDFTCLDERQLPIAKVETEVWKFAGGNRIQLVESIVDNEAAKEELLFAALALSYATMVLMTATLAA